MDVERAVLDLALDPSDSYLAVVCVDIAADTTAVSSGVRTFEVGRPRPAADDESDEGDDAEDEDEEEVGARGGALTARLTGVKLLEQPVARHAGSHPVIPSAKPQPPTPPHDRAPKPHPPPKPAPNPAAKPGPKLLPRHAAALPIDPAG